MDFEQHPYSTPQASGQLVADDAVIEVLQRTRPWVQFLGILGLIGAGFMVLAGLVMGATTLLGEELGIPGFGVGLALVYVLLSLLYVFPSIYLIQYAKKISLLRQSPSQEALAQALAKVYSFWRFIGIAAIVVLGLYFLVFIGGIFAGIAGVF